MNEPWWKRAVVYQIYPRSFADATKSGVGDLAGIRGRLDYLSWLGVDAIWLSPFYRSPMADFGYDVSDYCDVDPLFGTLRDFDALLADAHAANLRVIIDWVPAHTSSEHPWFLEARASRDAPRRDWYVWRDPGPDGALPNNWAAAFVDGPAWTLDEATGQYYLHSFLPEQPDLNWENPAVRGAMHDVLRFWLERGVDGFRADVVHNIGKDPGLASIDPEQAHIPHCVFNDAPITHEYLREIRKVVDEYDDRLILGEVTLSTERILPYYGRSDELHLSFNFPPLFRRWAADRWRRSIGETIRVLDANGAWPTWVLSNHDVARHRTRYGSEARARAAAVLLLSLRGTPFMYMGEELGLEDAAVPGSRVVDPGGRDGCRAPLPWTREAPHGWGEQPWLPFPPEPERRNAESLRDDDGSILHLYRRLLAARRASAALQCGTLELVDAPEGCVAYRRAADGDERRVAINFSGERMPFAGDGWIVEVASDGAGEGSVLEDALAPDRAVLLRRS